METIFLHEMSEADLINSLIEIKLPSPDSFLIIRETLTRMGVTSHKSNTLYQSCHILSKRGKYYIVHFKELFALDGREVSFSKEDAMRRNLIISTIIGWGLAIPCGDIEVPSSVPKDFLTIIPHHKKNQWNLSPKYCIGRSPTKDRSIAAS